MHVYTSSKLTGMHLEVDVQLEHRRHRRPARRPVRAQQPRAHHERRALGEERGGGGAEARGERSVGECDQRTGQGSDGGADDAGAEHAARGVWQRQRRREESRFRELRHECGHHEQDERGGDGAPTRLAKGGAAQGGEGDVWRRVIRLVRIYHEVGENEAQVQQPRPAADEHARGRNEASRRGGVREGEEASSYSSAEDECCGPADFRGLAVAAPSAGRALT